MKIDFQVEGIPRYEAEALLQTAESMMGTKRLRVDAKPGYPCRFSLADADIGEEVLLLSYEHHAVASPYRSSGPIFIRTSTTQATLAPNEIPKMLRHRLLSLRVYDREAMMMAAHTAQGTDLESFIQRIFEDPIALYIQVHNAGPGCYNCQINRVN
ncbi:MAG: DUF1203 domain-containing protein [Saprospiraceae bacterium]|nr:DUF1203 domain-containing protein [Saprospiraceae bacterium]